MELTTNAIWALHNVEQLREYQPVVQVLRVECMRNRFHRMKISDGFYENNCIVSSNLYNTVTQKVKDYTLIKLEEFCINYVQNIPILLLRHFSVTRPHAATIGNPKPYIHRPIHTNSSLDAKTTKKFEIARNGSMKLSTHSLNYSSPTVPQLLPESINPLPSSNTIQPIQYTPIQSLVEYNNTWVIKARISFKSRLIENYIPRYSGKMFQICILDRYGEIECSFVNESVELFEKLEAGKVYSFSGGYVYPGKYTHAIQGSDTYISFKKMPDIQEQPDDPNIPSVRYFFTKIIDLHSMNDKIIDVIGIIAYISPLISIYNRDRDKETKLRTITIMDNSESCIEIKIWNETAEMEVFDTLSPLGDTILVLKNARVKKYNQSRQISVFQVTDIVINPNHPEVAPLREWVYHKKRKLAGLDLVYKNSVCIPSTLYDIKYSWKDRMEEGYKYVFIVNICVGFVKDFNKFDCIYESCPENNCRRKLVIGSEFTHLGRKFEYFCIKCRKYYDTCGYSYGITCKIIDNSDSVYAVGYNELGESLYGMTASEFKFIESQDSPQDYSDILSKAKHKYFTAHLSVTKLQGNLSFVIDKLSTIDPIQSLSFYSSELQDILQEYNILQDRT